jgi:hypothetical protein
MTTQNTVVVDAAPHAASAVSWGAIIAGAVVAASLSLLLLALGTGLGLSSWSPWAFEGASATTLGFGAAIWMLIVHVVGAAGGGYLAGRMRTRWFGVDPDEVYFRDTAHGFMVWALSVVISASLLAGAAAAVVGVGALHTAAAVANDRPGEGSYVVDTLLRSDKPADPADQPIRAELGRIYDYSPGGVLSAPDRTYVAKVVAARTGMSQADAEKRVDEVAAQTKAAADKARKAGAMAALWSVVSLLAGAFAASFAAACGGRHRDNVRLVAPLDTGMPRRV